MGTAAENVSPTGNLEQKRRCLKRRCLNGNNGEYCGSEAEKEAQDHNIELWDFRDLIKEIAQTFKGNHGYFKDDTLRTLQLFARATGENKRT